MWANVWRVNERMEFSVAYLVDTAVLLLEVFIHFLLPLMEEFEPDSCGLSALPVSLILRRANMSVLESSRTTLV